MYSHPDTVIPPQITVNALRQEKVELENVLSHDLQQEVREVLQQEGGALGWRPVPGRDQVYVNQVHPQVAVEIDASQRSLVIQRRTSSTVDEALRDSTQVRLNQLLEEITPAYDIALNRLWDRCYSRTIERAARELGSLEERVEQTDPILAVHTVKIYLTV